MKLRFLTMLCAIVLCLASFSTPVLAAEAVGGGTPTFNTQEEPPPPTTGTSGNSSSRGALDGIKSAEEVLGLDPNKVVTTDDVDNWVARKGNDIIRIMTRGVQVISFGGFLVSIAILVVGATGDKRSLSIGFIALIVSCVAFSLATCAPQIIGAVFGWLRN